jgi:hypothetical protein
MKSDDGCVYTLPEEDFEINAASIRLPGLRR